MVRYLELVIGLIDLVLISNFQLYIYIYGFFMKTSSVLYIYTNFYVYTFFNMQHYKKKVTF